MVYNLDILNICKFHLFDPAVPAEDELLFAHAAVSGHVEDHEEVVDKGGVHPETIITSGIQTSRNTCNKLCSSITCMASPSHS